jgi:hypothetical protein
MVTNDNTVDLLSHVSQQPFPGLEIRYSVVI